MITQNLLLSFVSQAPANLLDSKKANGNDKNPISSFKNLLDKAVNDTPSKKTTPKSYNQEIKPKENIKKDSEPEKNFSSFREINQKVNSEKIKDSSKAASKTDSIDNTADASNQDDEAKKIKAKADVAVESLAAVLGIKPEELKKLLDSMDVKPEDMLTASKTSEIVNKLSDLMGLNTNQKQALTDIVEVILKKVDSLQLKPIEAESNEPVKANNALGNEEVPLVKSESSNVRMVDETSDKKGLEDILAKLKSQVEVLTQKLQQNQTNVFSNVKAVVEQVLNQNIATGEEKSEVPEETIQPSVKDTANTDEDQKLSETNEKADKSQVKASAQEKSDNKENNKQENQSSRAAEDTSKTSQEEVKVTDSKAVQFNSLLANQPQKTGTQIHVSKLDGETPIPKSEIINQVIERAKVTLTGEKSEMVMDLKPDSLGKLALKVVTERGMVVAKFVAESQQVKEVIESNMQLLKDSLEKQGLSVQGFSVSVQQDSSKGFNRFNETSDKGSKGNSRPDSTNGNMVNGVELTEREQKPNPYLWSESKINLTA